MSSAKWRAMQQRHRYTYNAVEFPSIFSEALSASPIAANSRSTVFFNDITLLAQFNSTYSQVTHSKSLASSFSGFVSILDLRDDDDRVLLKSASRFYLELLFLENSFPLHRVLLSGLFKVGSKDAQGVICDCFDQLFEEYSVVVFEKTKRFCLSRVSLSVMGMPKLHYLASVVEGHADTVACDVIQGLESVISETEASARPSPIVLEQCQEGSSCLYYLIQRFPDNFKVEGMNTTKRILNALMRVLKSMAFSRDCFVSAGVSFCAALQVCLSREELGQLILQSIFSEKQCRIRSSSCDEATSDTLVSKVPFEGDLFGEIRTITPLSRLCLMRGILTALSRELLNIQFTVVESSAVKTILFDATLPELCSYGENPPDSHFNFHALTVLQICLQQIKASIDDKVTAVSGNYSPISEDMSTRILKLVWKNLEDPLNQTVKQVHLIFDLFLDIMATENDGMKFFLRKIATDLLHLSPRCKGRYVPLSLLTKRLGAKVLLDIRQSLLSDSILAYIDDDVCCAATTFLKCFLENLRDQCWESDGVESGYENFRIHCLFPFLSGLASGASKLRSNINTYALSVLLEVDVGIIFPMLDVILVGAKNGGHAYDVEQKIAILISILKVSRSLALVEGDIDFEDNTFACVRIKGINVSVPVEWLEMSLTHVDEFLRVDAAESLFLNPKTSTIPSTLELLLLGKAIPLNMRSVSSGFQMKWTSLFRKFFSRVRTALERQHKLGAWKNDQVDEEEISPKRANELLSFMKWLSSFLFFSCYPSAPYKRKIMAMDLILIMLNVWPLVSSTDRSASYIHPYSNGITSPNFTSLLVASIIDSWDKLRENSVRILLYFPTPLPGISLEKDVVQLVSWTKTLVCSPRVRESDAGAQTFRLIFLKYVVEMKCLIRVSPQVSCFMLVHVNSVYEYMSSLVHWLNCAVLDGERDLSEACSNCFVHGVLLTLRYTFEEFDWNSNYSISTIEEMKILLQKLLELISRITSIALWVVSADAWFLPNEDDNDFITDDVDLTEIHEQVRGDSFNDQLEKRSQEQIVMVGCWLAMKEVSLLLGTIVRKIPLPSSSSCDSASVEILDVVQLKHIGNHFLEVLLKMKHNGAIDKTRAGFTALCNRLLCSNDPNLCRLTESWMGQLMERTTAKCQVVDDLLRRSAGIPAAFMALFLSEPEGSPKKLLPRALRWLIDLAASLLNDEFDCSTTSADDFYDNKNVSKIRKEGVIPTVHAFNVLRACFNDTNLSVDTSGFAAEALILSIRSFSSPHWEIRNSACLAYTALIRRIIGFMNTHKRESARRALTGLEFFHRYPSLHTFVFNELKIATDSLVDDDMESNLVKALHPSLCPLLILLSRLKPSSIASETGDALDPFLFLPFIKKCSMQSNMRIRVLSTKAVTCLVSNEKLPSVLLNIASELPSFDKKSSSSFNTVHGILLQLSSLIDSNCRNLADFPKKEKMINDLVSLVAKYEWIGTPSHCPCPTLNASYLKLLDVMLSVLRTGERGVVFSTLHALLLKLSGECLELEDSYGLRFYDPTIAESRKHAAISLFNCLVYLPKEDWQASQMSDLLSLPFPATSERILQSLLDSSYEVRLVTLKWLFRFVKFLGTFSDEVHEIRTMIQWVNTDLQPKLMELLDHEKRHKCVHYILKLLFALNSSRSELGSLGYENVHSFWEKLMFMYQNNRHAKTEEQIICCFATCVKYFSRQLSILVASHSAFELERASKLFDLLKYFVDVTEQHSSSCDPVNMRRAAVDSLVASGLLEQAEPISHFVTNNELFSQSCSSLTPQNAANMYGRLVVKVWFICVKLLEDEDDVVRESLALAIQKLVSSERAPSQVEKVINLCFNHLFSKFGKWAFFLDCVCELVYNEANFTSNSGHLVRQLFDKEIDNHHEEKLLICQLSCFHLEKLDFWLSEGVDLKDFLHSWRLKFLKQCIDFGVSHSKKEVGMWIGGVGNHKDVFFPLYGNMLGFYAVSKCVLGGVVEDKSALVGDVVELGRVICPFLTSSFISCLYAAIVGIHEDKLGSSFHIFQMESDHRFLWDNFDPYFLFR